MRVRAQIGPSLHRVPRGKSKYVRRLEKRHNIDITAIRQAAKTARECGELGTALLTIVDFDIPFCPMCIKARQQTMNPRLGYFHRHCWKELPMDVQSALRPTILAKVKAQQLQMKERTNVEGNRAGQQDVTAEPDNGGAHPERATCSSPDGNAEAIAATPTRTEGDDARGGEVTA